jgi:hypothetical protein
MTNYTNKKDCTDLTAVRTSHVVIKHKQH